MSWVPVLAYLFGRNNPELALGLFNSIVIFTGIFFLMSVIINPLGVIISILIFTLGLLVNIIARQ